MAIKIFFILIVRYYCLPLLSSTPLPPHSSSKPTKLQNEPTANVLNKRESIDYPTSFNYPNLLHSHRTNLTNQPEFTFRSNKELVHSRHEPTPNETRPEHLPLLETFGWF